MDDIAPGGSADAAWRRQRRKLLRDSLGIGAATGAYGLSFAAIATANGLSLLQAAALSLLVFTGASQFAFVGVLGAGGGALAAAATAMTIIRPDERSARVAFWVTGGAVFVFWNLATLVGALGAQALDDPRVLGLDAAAPAAFLALLAPQCRTRQTRVLAVAAVVLALWFTLVLPAGLPILAVAVVAVLVGFPRLPGKQTP